MRREKHARDHEYVHTHCRQVQNPRRCTLALLEAERRGIAHSPSALGPHCLVPPAPQSFAHTPTTIDNLILRVFDWASNPAFEPPARDVRRFSRVSCGDASSHPLFAAPSAAQIAAPFANQSGEAIWALGAPPYPQPLMRQVWTEIAYEIFHYFLPG